MLTNLLGLDCLGSFRLLLMHKGNQRTSSYLDLAIESPGCFIQCYLLTPSG